MAKLLALFVIVPMIELVLLIELGRHIGTFQTLALICFTGVLGAFIARQQGIGVLQKLQSELAQGQMPAETLIDGALILVAGAVLMTPGVLTDAFGFFCLIPAGRKLIKGLAAHRWRAVIEAGRASMNAGPSPTTATQDDGPVIDVTPESSRRDL